jgi:hypothetical protein
MGRGKTFAVLFGVFAVGAVVGGWKISPFLPP